MLRLAVVLVLGVLAQQTFADKPEAIVGGTPAAPGEFPWQCSLRLRGSHICGCAIISSTKILTAAHCVENMSYPPYNDFHVVTGTIDNRGGQVCRMKTIRMHPGYVPHVSRSWVNDIAVITLHQPIQFDRLQAPISMAGTPPQPGMSCTLSGWGMTQANGQVPQYLLKMHTTCIDRSTCQSSHRRQPIYDSHMCVYNRHGIGACQGDSGGPLVCGGVLYGITSWVLPCAVGAPDVFTSVYHQRSFINQAIALD